MDKFIKRKSIIKGQFTKMNNYVKVNCDNLSYDELKAHLDHAHRLYSEFVAVEDSMFEIDADVPSEMDIIDESYFTIVAKIQSSMRSKSNVNMVPKLDESINANTSGHAISDFKLPSLQMPKFDGKLQEWQSFFDIFTSTVHENVHLSPAQKFQYLMGLLKGSAYDLVKHFRIDDANYLEAYQRLVKRYNKKKPIVESYIKSLLDQPKIHKGTASGITKLHDHLDEVVRGLKALGQDAESRDPWLIYIILEKLDDGTKQVWKYETADNDFPTIQEFLDFLMKRMTAITDHTACSMNQSSNNKLHHSKSQSSAKLLHTVISPSCPLCPEETHRLFDCGKFSILPIADRREFLKVKGRCFNCLSDSHTVYQCRTKRRCRTCNKKHNTLVHLNSEPIANVIPETTSNSKAITAHVSCSDEIIGETALATLDGRRNALIPTALLQIRNGFNTWEDIRGLLDSASTRSFITESCVNRLKLTRTNGRVIIEAINQTKAGRSRGITNIKIRSRVDVNYIVEVDALIVQNITSNLPMKSFERTSFVETLPLADPTFNQSGPIDMLLGSDIFISSITEGKLTDEPNNMVALNTRFGWIIGGMCHPSQKNQSSEKTLFTTEEEINIDRLIRRFWEIEEVSNQPIYTTEETNCINLYNNTTTINDQGRLIVLLPFRNKVSRLGDSLHQAKQRFYSLERKLSAHPSLCKQYTNFIMEYIELGHMEIIPKSEITKPVGKTFYLPHHGVIKDSSSTTKLRVVFDGSAKTTTGVSLNQELMIGPTIQQNLAEILLRYRKYRYVFSADIEKMYRQFMVQKQHTDYQRILWRGNPNEQLQHYRLLTVTYGTSSAPFLATYSLHYLANQIMEKYPTVANTIRCDFYVDDLMSGANTIEEAVILQKQLIDVLQSFGLKLRKWAANHAELLDHLPEEELEISCKEFHDGFKTISTLGIYYQPTQDVFKFRVNVGESSNTTKRQLLSEASRLFDPIGWLSPITIIIKCLFQQLWLEKLGWDDEIPDKHKEIWTTFRTGLKYIENINVPRWLETEGEFEIHGFADASKEAYAAVLYSRCIKQNGEICINLITAKTKVAPLKTISIPKLELCAATLLIKTLESTIKALMLTVKPRIFLYSDSTIVLNWLFKQPSTWPTYIANRTSQILTVTNRNQWYHIGSKENPADCASRGMGAKDLKNHSMWWNGPTFLQFEPIKIKEQLPLDEEGLQNNLTMLCTAKETNSTRNQIDLMADRISRYTIIVRVLARLGRLISQVKGDSSKPRASTISVEEVEWAERKLFKLIQLQRFSTEIELLERGIHPTKGKLVNFFPFLDSHGILRVSGRLMNANITYNTKHPIILPGDHPTIQKMVTYLHTKLLHAGPSQLLTHIKQKFQIIKAKSLVKKVVHNCLRCHRQNLKEQTQLMGQLPSSRVLLVRPFIRSGVDYAGPYSIKAHQQRNSRIIKGYLVIFVCMATKAVHFELVTNLSTETFLAALTRFHAVRGICSDIYSDNATNFIGARNQLAAFGDLLSSDDANDRIQNWSTQQGTKWHFIPPSAPTFGGLWEAAVKSTKFHIRRVIGDTTHNYEELLI